MKRPKIYFRDSGLLHSLLDVTKREELLVHPKLGASWEGFALEEVVRPHAAEEEDVYFWGVHQQLDLLVVRDNQKHGFEFKYGSAPRLTRQLTRARELLSLDSLTVVCPGDVDYRLAEEIGVKGLKTLLDQAG